MKKNYLPDFRRETKELIENNNISIHTIVTNLGVHSNTAYAWKDGKKSPSRRNFEALKQLASGELKQETKGDIQVKDILIAIGELKGEMNARFNQFEKRLEELEGKKKIHQT